jgi:molybdopterin synthase catalytic subunit
VIDKVRNDSCGCVASYVGLIRNQSHGKPVLSVEYVDSDGNAAQRLQQIADEVKRRWQVEDVAISHRVGKLKVGDINLVVAVGAAHCREGFAACRYVIDQFKKRLPTTKIETYVDSGISVGQATSDT